MHGFEAALVHTHGVTGPTEAALVHTHGVTGPTEAALVHTHGVTGPTVVTLERLNSPVKKKRKKVIITPDDRTS